MVLLRYVHFYLVVNSVDTKIYKDRASNEHTRRREIWKEIKLNTIHGFQRILGN